MPFLSKDVFPYIWGSYIRHFHSSLSLSIIDHLQGMFIKEIKVHHIIPQIHIVLFILKRALSRGEVFGSLHRAADILHPRVSFFYKYSEMGIYLKLLFRKSSIIVRSGFSSSPNCGDNCHNIDTFKGRKFYYFWEF